MKKRVINKLNVRFPSESSNESLARIIITGFMMPYDPTVEEIADVKTAVSEAVTNCIVHAYRHGHGEIEMKATYTDDRRITVTVKDKGCGIEDLELARQPLYTTDKENERSGMGFSIMESFSDSLTVTSKPQKGTKVTFTKTLSKRQKG